MNSDGDSFTGDAIFLPQINGDSFEKKIAQAREYWSGKIKVERIVEKYSD